MVADDAIARPLRLGVSWAAVLNRQPESGMGYQVVSIVLKDGRRIDNVTIVDGTISSAAGSEQLPFVEEDIVEIIVTHAKPGPHRQRL